MRLKAKILSSILLTAFVVFLVAISYISIRSRNIALQNAQAYVDAHAREYANLVKAELNTDINMSRAIAHSFLGYRDIPIEIRRDIYNNILKNIYIHNPGYLSVWTSFELSAYGDNYKKSYGRARTEIFENQGKVEIKEDSLNLEGDDTNSMYFNIKAEKSEAITEPYTYTYNNSSRDFLVSSICAPILENGRFIGLSGVDVDLERFQEIIKEIHPFKGSYALFISYEGTYIAHPNRKLINKSVKEIDSVADRKYQIVENIQKGESFSFTQRETDGRKYYVSYAPVRVGKSQTPWAIGIVVPLSEVMYKANRHFFITLLLGFLGMLILSYVAYRLYRYIVKPLKKITEIVEHVSQGEINRLKRMTVKTKDEIGQIRKSVNELILGLRRTAAFANKIADGDLSVDYEPLGPEDLLGKSLLNMRDSLINAQKEDEKRREEDRQRNWIAQGIGKFSEILRANNHDLEELSYQIISNLVGYMAINQGGLFIIEDENPKDIHLRLSGSYAYNRRKFQQKRIEIGEGFVGEVFLEKESHYLTNLPENYITISSGLGDHRPNALLLQPLRVNEETVGVIELAAFDEIPAYKRQFLEIVSESIASTIANVKSSSKANRLLQVTQKQTEERLQHEENMRQNMEELRATQEEMMRKQVEADENLKLLRNIIDMVPFPVFVKDYKRRYSIVNQAQASLFGLSADNMIGKRDSDLFYNKEELKSVQETDRQILEEGKRVKLPSQEITIKQEKRLLQTFKIPLQNTLTKRINILGVSIDITERRQIEQLKRDINKLED